ncbi:MAG: CRISPR-associated protein Csx15 [Chloroflexota bacterium]|nr:CRISPR-associated protein Csx15 [Chloroflexota bacterium]
MLILNFSHPITSEQQEQIQELTSKEITEIIDIPAKFDNDKPYPEQVRSLLDPLGIESKQWQTVPIVINPPSYNFAAVTLLAELHGRTGHFLPVIRIRPVPDSTPVRYEIAEIIDLHNVRNQARQKR